jgi:hypothetical protein
MLLFDENPTKIHENPVPDNTVKVNAEKDSP